MTSKISYEELIDISKESSCGIFDTRSSSAFIGWLVDGATKRGHIQGSRLLSASWLYYMEDAILSVIEEVRKTHALEHRVSELIKDLKHIVLYDNGDGHAEKIYEYISSKTNVPIYLFNINNWEGELITFPNYHLLVPPEWIQDLIKNASSDTYRILECSWGSANIVFEASHIPGAIHLNTDEFETAPEWLHRSLEDLKKVIIDNGLREDMTIVIYSSGDQGEEYKTAVILELLGFKDVRVMNGNYSQWRLKKLPVETGLSTKPNNGVLPQSLKFDVENKFTTISTIKKILNDSNSDEQVIDIRQWLERSGAESGYLHIPKAGRIPNTIYGDTWYLYKNIDETIRDPQDIYIILERQGIDVSKPMHFFCGSAGWGAAIVEKFMRVAGNLNAHIFEGGWGQWQLDPDNPVEDEVLPDEYAPTPAEAFLEVEQ